MGRGSAFAAPSAREADRGLLEGFEGGRPTTARRRSAQQVYEMTSTGAEHPRHGWKRATLRAPTRVHRVTRLRESASPIATPPVQPALPTGQRGTVCFQQAREFG